jgi:hypothetical protein
VSLELHAGIPLFVGHLEQVDPRNRAGNVQQRVDTTELCQGPVDDGFGSRWRHEIQIDGERLGTIRLNLFGNLAKRSRTSCCQHDSREIPGKPDRGRPSDSGTRAGHNCYCL